MFLQAHYSSLISFLLFQRIIFISKVPFDLCINSTIAFKINILSIFSGLELDCECIEARKPFVFLFFPYASAQDESETFIWVLKRHSYSSQYSQPLAILGRSFHLWNISFFICKLEGWLRIFHYSLNLRTLSEFLTL